MFLVVQKGPVLYKVCCAHMLLAARTSPARREFSSRRFNDCAHQMRPSVGKSLGRDANQHVQAIGRSVCSSVLHHIRVANAGDIERMCKHRSSREIEVNNREAKWTGQSNEIVNWVKESMGSR